MSQVRTCYTKILVFVKELKNVFPRPEVKLYYKLLKETNIDNETALEKHVSIWKDWMEPNKSAIIDGELDKISSEPISFNARIFIPLCSLIANADKDTKKVILQHCRLICYLFWPSEDLKTALVTKKAHEEEFMDNFFDKVQTSFQNKQVSNPLEATMQIFQSGVFNELVEGLTSGIENKTLDPNRLYDNLAGMMSNMGINPSGGNFMNMMSGMLSGSGPAANPLDMIGSMMGGQPGQPGTTTVGFDPMAMLNTMMSSGLDPMSMLGGMMGEENNNEK